MRIEVHREHLTRAINAVERATARSSTLPILANILFEADTNSLRLTATNLEIGITATIPAKTGESIRLAAPTRVLSECIKATRGDVVSIDATATSLSLSAGGYRTKILCFDASEYPLTPKLDGGFVTTIPVSDIEAIFSAALDSIPVSDSRQELSGAFVVFEPTHITAAATDGFRLVERRASATNPQGLSVIIPRTTVSEVLRVLSGADGLVTLRVAENQIAFLYNDIVIVSRLIDGRYPDYKKIIPEHFLAKALVRRDDLEYAVKAAALFSSSISDIQLSCAESVLTISARSSEKGDASADVEINLKGEPFTVSMNYQYLLDGLRALHDERVVLKFTGKGSPFVITPSDSQDEALYLIMPLRQ